MSFTDLLREKYKRYLLDKCKEKKCKIVLKDLNNYIILDAENIYKKSSNGKMCDCIICTIFDNDQRKKVAIVELKSKNLTASEVYEKLQNGGDLIQNILKENQIKYSPSEFYLIALAKRWDQTELRMIESKKIRINNKKLFIITEKCGKTLLEIFDKYSVK